MNQKTIQAFWYERRGIAAEDNDGAGVIEQVGEGVDAKRISERGWLYETQQGRPF